MPPLNGSNDPAKGADSLSINGLLYEHNATLLAESVDSLMSHWTPLVGSFDLSGYSF